MTLKVTAIVADVGVRAPSVYQTLKFVCLPVRKILGINRPGDLEL